LDDFILIKNIAVNRACQVEVQEDLGREGAKTPPEKALDHPPQNMLIFPMLRKTAQPTISQPNLNMNSESLSLSLSLSYYRRNLTFISPLTLPILFLSIYNSGRISRTPRKAPRSGVDKQSHNGVAHKKSRQDK